MNKAYLAPRDDNPAAHTESAHLPDAVVNMELRFQSEYCSVSGGPLCFLQATVRATGSRQVSLNRARPIIEFLEATDHNAPSGLPRLSFFDTTEGTKQPIFSYQLDVCHQEDRERQLESSEEGIKSGDFIPLSEKGYTFTHCINQPWGFLITYYLISKVSPNQKYRLGIGSHSEVSDPGGWYPRTENRRYQAGTPGAGSFFANHHQTC